MSSDQDTPESNGGDTAQISLLEKVFEQLLGEIVSGRYPEGSRLPAERELAQTMGASRPTLREALRRLGEWGLIEARRSSGVVVRSRHDWTFDVLPAYLRYGLGAMGPRAAVEFVKDLLEVRRLIFMDIFRMVAPRLAPGSLNDARAAVARAWATRSDLATFLREDVELVKSIVRAANFLPALALLNSFARSYLDLARNMTSPAVVPDDYLESWAQVLTALERNDADTACQVSSRYLGRHDDRLISVVSTLLGVSPVAPA